MSMFGGSMSILGRSMSMLEGSSFEWSIPNPEPTLLIFHDVFVALLEMDLLGFLCCRKLRENESLSYWVYKIFLHNVC